MSGSKPSDEGEGSRGSVFDGGREPGEESPARSRRPGISQHEEETGKHRARQKQSSEVDAAVVEEETCPCHREGRQVLRESVQGRVSRGVMDIRKGVATNEPVQAKGQRLAEEGELREERRQQER